MTTRREILSFLTGLPAGIRYALGLVGSEFVAAPAADASIGDGQQHPLIVRHTSPAAGEREGLSIGNGLFGATISGRVDRERLALNESSLWSGEPKDWNVPSAKAVLPEIRKLLFDGKFYEADILTRRLEGPYTQTYLPMGDLWIRWEHGSKTGGTGADEYARELNLRTAIVTVDYSFGQTGFKREYFASYPDKVIVMRFTSSAPGRIGFLARMDSPLRFRTSFDGNTYVMRGKAPYEDEPNYENVDPAVLYGEDESGPGMAFDCHLRAAAKGGKRWVDADGVHVQGADEAVLLMTGATSYNGYDKSPSKQGRDCRAAARADRILPHPAVQGDRLPARARRGNHPVTSFLEGEGRIAVSAAACNTRPSRAGRGGELRGRRDTQLHAIK